MLKYLVLVTEELVMAGIIVGIIMGKSRSDDEHKGMIFSAFSGAAILISSVIMAFLIYSTNIVNIGYSNLAMHFAFILGFVLFIVSLIPFINNRVALRTILRYISLFMMMFSAAFYSIPDVLTYPLEFDLAGNTVFSTDFIYRFTGYLLGIIVTALIGLGSYKCIRNMSEPLKTSFVSVILAVNALLFAGKAIQVMRTRMIIMPSEFTFKVIMITLNYGKWFIFLVVAAIGAASMINYVRNIRIKEDYSNSAELRKIKAGKRRIRRWSIALLLVLVVSVVELTAIDAYNNKGPEEAPVETCKVKGNNCEVDISLVEDGHLHRFGYTTPDGVVTKFIVVRKPGSTAYGVGLDACDICGDAGYYEKNDQIVCKRCDVVMNKNTIGFKGGCNPIVIDYSVENGKIIVPTKGLIDNQKEFQ